MNTSYFDKYIKYKSKYLNLTSDVKNITNQTGGANRYIKQFMITVMLNITDSNIRNNIAERYNKIKELINGVETQEPHFTLFQIIINGNNKEVKNKINEYLKKNIGRSEQNAVHYYIGNFIKEINILIQFHLLKYTRGIQSYTIFENDEKYFYCKVFEIMNKEIKNEVNDVLIDLLKNVFSSENNPKNNIINNKECKVYFDINNDEIFYYNDFYQTQTTLHITIAKIEKTKWEKYNAFNITQEDSKNYLLYVCNKIISNARPLLSKTIIDKNDLQLKVTTQQKI